MGDQHGVVAELSMASQSRRNVSPSRQSRFGALSIDISIGSWYKNTAGE
jgi:hypothetical protein